MNLRAIANRATSAINPNLLVAWQKCVGYATAPGFHRVPDYAPAVDVPMQVQALTVKDLQHLDSMNLAGGERGGGGAEHAVFTDVPLTAVDRKSQTGGDLLTFTMPSTGTRDVWLVTAVLESWGVSGWGRYAVTKQTDTADG